MHKSGAQKGDGRGGGRNFVVCGVYVAFKGDHSEGV